VPNESEDDSWQKYSDVDSEDGSGMNDSDLEEEPCSDGKPQVIHP